MKFNFLIIFIFIIKNHVDCDINDTCDSGQFKCLNGQCIDSKLICNNWPDCYDFSDELNVTGCKSKYRRGLNLIVQPLIVVDEGNKLLNDRAVMPPGCPSDLRSCIGTGCGPDFVYCEVHRLCDWRNGKFNCSKQCSPDQFRCSSHYCINQTKVCDGRFNCFNHMDEFNCRDRTSIINITEIDARMASRHKHFVQINTRSQQSNTNSFWDEAAISKSIWSFVHQQLNIPIP
ncbi:prolow-density lipoprotein receptor-related protein 1-like [Panonychus citri]|uniref:prolow-density lipoprotein receptor-related protein 1-like n=1 Tax=Panonychus citri TaxID=50023 RepID=UPI00230733D3|nr:prolow-density lipoprotein receptor-related protein 1-like [Panonychus citri]